MNRFTKFTLLTAVLLCIIGGILVTAGIAGNGLNDLADATQNTSGTLNGTSKEYRMDKTRLEDITNIQVELSNMSFQILPSDDDFCYLSYQTTGGKKNPVSYEVKDGTLSLKENDRNISFSSGIDYGSLTDMLLGKKSDSDSYDYLAVLYLPKETILKSADIHLDYGDVIIRGLTADSFDVSLNCGDLNIRELNADSFDVSLNCGDLNIRELNADAFDASLDYGDATLKDCHLNNGTLKMSDGDTSVTGTLFTGKNIIESSYGDVSVTLDEEQKDALNLSCSTSYGEINLPKSLQDSASRLTSSDDIQEFEKQGTDPSTSFTVKCNDGDITIQ